MITIHSFDDDTIQQVFGHEAAEDDDLARLKKFYFKNTAYARLRASNALRILIGHKGIGKSAMLTVATSEDRAQNKLAILLRPDDIADALEECGDMNSMIRAWKNGLLRIIQGKVAAFFALQSHDASGLFGGTTWGAIANDLATTMLDWVKSKRITLDDTRAAVLHMLESEHIIRIYVDDLDRGWTATRESVMRMSAMLNAMRDISREYSNVHFIVSLRSDVFFLVRTSDESTDKLESACIWFSWNNHEILAMLMKRIKTYFGLSCPTDKQLVEMDQHELTVDLWRVMSDRFHGKGNWENIPTYRMLMTLIRRRPRDLVKLCTLAARHAFECERSCITTEDFDSIFSRYSQDRLQDTINEYRSELPNIQALLENMKPKPNRKEEDKQRGRYVFTTAEMLVKLKNISENHRFIFFGQRSSASAKELMNFLYKIGYITARKKLSSGKILRHFFEEQNYVSSQFADYGYEWEIHPAYRWALSPSDRNPWNEIDCLDE